MFSFQNFLVQGFLRAVGHQPDYWIMLNAAAYADRGVLTMGALAEIQAAIDAQYMPEQPEEEAPAEAETEGVMADV